MTRPRRVLVTGFGPFPGAPYNPTEALVARLVRLRRPALADAEIVGHIFRVGYGAVDRDLPALLAAHDPDAILMFGLAQRTPYLRIETRARNTVTGLWPDADHTTVNSHAIVEQGPANQSFGPHTAQLFQAARATGAWTMLSRDAGRYVCNYLSWKVVDAAKQGRGRPVAAFVHVPLVPRPAMACRASPRRRVSFEELVDAGEALLMTMVKLARRPNSAAYD